MSKVFPAPSILAVILIDTPDVFLPFPWRYRYRKERALIALRGQSWVNEMSTLQGGLRDTIE